MEKEIKWKLIGALKTIRLFDWLLNSYVLDFYVENHWDRLPKSWRQCLNLIEPVELEELLLDNVKLKKNWPLSLLALKKLSSMYCIQRTPLENPLASNPKFPIPKILLKHIKPKKLHEIQIMAKITKASADKMNISKIVDFGSGLGHFARYLSFYHRLDVNCLEMYEELTKQAYIIDEKLMRLEKGRNDFSPPTHLTIQVLSKTKLVDDVLELTRDPKENFGIVGLHPCGDLAPILMEKFLECPQARFLNIVGCCYMKLSAIGYPISEFAKSTEKLAHLSYEAREVAVHANEKYADRLSNVTDLKVHSYRATLERILIKHWPKMKHIGLRSVRHSNDMDFEQYCAKSLSNHKDIKLPIQEMHSTQTKKDLDAWKRVVVFYTLRLLIAPFVESAILYDRQLFLIEHNCDCSVFAVFDPRISPRCHVMIATKRE